MLLDFFPVIQISNSAEGGSLVKDIPSTKDGRVDWSQVKLQMNAYATFCCC